MPLAARTYPEIVPGLSVLHAGSARPSINTENPSLRSISNPPPRERPSVSVLLYGESHRGVHRLLGNVVVHLDLKAINTRIKVGGRESFLQGHLVANVAHLVRGFDGMNHGLIRRRIDHIVLDRGRRLVRFVVHTEIVNLHPEVQL